MLQQNLPGFATNGRISISEASKLLNVSEASIRNWIRTGYLQCDASGVSLESIEDFRKNVAGRDKLNSRANKSMADEHDHSQLVANVLAKLESVQNCSGIGDDYQNGLSDAYRNREGVYYTPPDICRTMFSDFPEVRGNESFCDPCCGSGNFMLAAIHHGFKPENVHGFDTDPTAVEITKRRILEETGYVTENIMCEDFLTHASSLPDGSQEYDMIVTNPPWGKKLHKEEKTLLGGKFGAGGSLDSCSLFFHASLRTLKPDGYLALLVPESFFKIATFEDARKKLLEHTVICLRDFGKPFTGLITKAQSFGMRKADSNAEQVRCANLNRTFQRRQKSFCENPAHIINFESCADDTSVAARMFEVPHIKLEGKAGWGLGIVTGNNSKFCHAKPGKGLMPVYRGVDVHKGRLDPPATFIPTDLSNYQQVAPTWIFEARGKIMYRFISSNLVFCYDTSGSYCLNSVNMIVPSDDFPVPAEMIVKLFNTDLFNWLHKTIFNTHKVLRADLEKLPIPVEFLRNRESLLESELLDYYGIRRSQRHSFRIG